ncbi:PepSY domain-containing protein [Streptomyces synnematoformans]|uniref:PepSY domain-containing protein n=1 Tax=Streptomyces synnematoformans TaxID=415721 RepID=A0ABP5JE68_9ACTN
MKRNIVIAAVATAALVTGGTVTAVAVADDDGAEAASMPADVRVGDDGADDRDDRDDDGDGDDRDDDGRDDDGDGRAEAEALAAAKVTVDDAVAAALQERAGTVESAEFDGDDRGAHRWEIDILGDDGTWYEVAVDAGSGEVVADRGDDGRDEDADDRNDRDDRDDRRDDDGKDDDRDDRRDDADDRGDD